MFDADDLTHKIMNLDVNDAMDEATFQDHLLLFKGLFIIVENVFIETVNLKVDIQIRMRVFSANRR